MTLPQPSARPLVWENLPPARQQELTRLFASLLSQYLTAQTKGRSQPHPEEMPHERASQNP